MPSQLLLDMSLDQAIQGWVPKDQRPRFLAIPKVSLQVTYPVGNGLLWAKLWKICLDVYTECIKTSVVPLLLSVDKQYAKSQDFYRLRGLREKMLQNLQTELQKANNRALQQIGSYCAIHKEYLGLWQSYQRHIGIKVVTGVVGVGASAAGFILSGGSASVLAIYGAYRAVVGTLNTFAECCLTAGGTGAIVKSNLESLKKDYENGQTDAGTKAIGKTVANWVVNLNAAPTVRTLKENNELWKGKLAHLYSLAFELHDELERLLDHSVALTTQLEGDPDSEKKKAALKKLTDQVSSLLTEEPGKGYKIKGLRNRVTITGALQGAEKGLKEQEEVEKGLRELEQMQGKFVKRFEEIFPLVASLALAGVGTGLEATSLAGEVATALPEEAGKVAGKIADAGVKTLSEGFEIGFEEVGPMIAAAWGLEDKDFPKAEEIEANKKKELETYRPRLNAVVLERPRQRLNAVSLQRKPG